MNASWSRHTVTHLSKGLFEIHPVTRFQKSHDEARQEIARSLTNPGPRGIGPTMLFLAAERTAVTPSRCECFHVLSASFHIFLSVSFHLACIHCIPTLAFSCLFWSFRRLTFFKIFVVRECPQKLRARCTAPSFLPRQRGQGEAEDDAATIDPNLPTLICVGQST